MPLTTPNQQWKRTEKNPKHGFKPETITRWSILPWSIAGFPRQGAMLHLCWLTDIRISKRPHNSSQYCFFTY